MWFWKKRKDKKETTFEITKTYEDLLTEHQAVVDERLRKQNECAKKGMSFDEMLEETRELSLMELDLDSQIRMVKQPTMQFGKKWKGKFFSMKDFVEFSKNGSLTSNDGHGFYASELGVSDIDIYPEDILNGRYRNDFTRVLWFGK